GVAENLLGLTAVVDDVIAHRQADSDRRGHRLDVGGVDLFQLFDPPDYLVELAGHALEVCVGNSYARQRGDPRHCSFVERHAVFLEWQIMGRSDPLLMQYFRPSAARWPVGKRAGPYTRPCRSATLATFAPRLRRMHV